MREADLHNTQHHPTAMDMILSVLRINCYWILLDFDGGAGVLLHRYCTANQEVIYIYQGL